MDFMHSINDEISLTADAQEFESNSHVNTMRWTYYEPPVGFKSFPML